MNINMLLWWSLGRGNTVVPSRWQATVDGVVPALPLRPLGRLQVLAIFGRVPSH
jgi:hypothetical protein